MSTDRAQDPPPGFGPGDVEAAPPGSRQLAELAPGLSPQGPPPARPPRRLLGLALVALVLGTGLFGLGACRMFGHTSRLIAETEASLDSNGRLPGAAPVLVEANGATRAVLLIHGWASAPADWHDLPQQLAERGVSAHAMLLPGHGTSPRTFGEVELAEYRAAVEREFDDLASRYDEVAVAGFSMGAALALDLATRRDVDRVALMAPYFDIHDPTWTILPVHTWARLLDGLVPFVDSGPSPVALNKQENADRIVKYRVLPLSAMRPLCEIGLYVREPEVLEAITAPVLMIVSEGDEAADPDIAKDAFKDLGSGEKELVVVHRSSHQLLHDHDAEQVTSELLTFLSAPPIE